MADKLKSLALDAAIVGGSAALTALSAWAANAELGIWGPIAVAVLTALAKAIQKLGPDAADRVVRTWRGE